ncbi:unnamed protein product, partial [Amoebophrya sp. A120]
PRWLRCVRGWPVACFCCRACAAGARPAGWLPRSAADMRPPSSLPRRLVGVVVGGEGAASCFIPLPPFGCGRAPAAGRPLYVTPRWVAWPLPRGPPGGPRGVCPCWNATDPASSAAMDLCLLARSRAFRYVGRDAPRARYPKPQARLASKFGPPCWLCLCVYTTYSA